MMNVAQISHAAIQNFSIMTRHHVGNITQNTIPARIDYKPENRRKEGGKAF